MLRIGLVDDHPVALYGVVKFLEGATDVTLAVAVAGIDELPRLPDGGLDMDLLVMDLYLDGDQPAIPEIAELSGTVPILVMTASSSPFDVLAAIRAGAAGYLTKQAGRDTFL